MARKGVRGVVGGSKKRKKATANTVKARRGNVAQGAMLTQTNGGAKPAMTREEVEAYIDEKFIEKFPELVPLGGPVSQLWKAMEEYWAQEKKPPRFVMMPTDMIEEIAKQLSVHPQWGSRGKKLVAGVELVEGVEPRILAGR